MRFRQTQPFLLASATYLSAEYGAATDASGAFAISVPVPDTGTVAYLIELPDGTAAAVHLGSGAATTLELLLAGAFAVGTAPDVLILLQSLVDTHAALRASTTVFGHVEVDGTTITSAAGVISAVGGGGGGGPPTGAAGGVLGGTYPNPSFAADMATQAELNTEASTRATADTANSGAITNEASARSSADSTLQTNITNEASARAAADALLAPLANPALTGVPTAPTAVSATDSTQLATTAFVHALLTALLNSAPANLDTLGEIATQLATDESALSALITTVSGKLAKASNLSDLTDAAAARTNLGLGGLAVLSAVTASLISDASANGRSLITATDYAAMRTLLGLAALALKSTIATADIDADAVTYAKIQNVSATDKVLGRSTAGAGDVEEIAFTAAMRALADDASAQAQRVTLGVNVFTAVADANYTALATDVEVLYTSITAARTVTLPAASALNAGQALVIGDASGSVTGVIPITIARAGSDTINGATSYVIGTPRGMVRLISDGSSKWYFDVVGPGRGGVVIDGRAKNSDATIYYSVPGQQPATTSTLALVANVVRYFPIVITTPITINQLALEVTTVGAGSTTARLGIYNADTDWQATSLLLDAGTVAVDSLGVKTITVSQILTPGRYLFAINSDGTPQMRTVRGGANYLGYDSIIGASPFVTGIRGAQTYGAFPGTGTAWNTISGAATPNHYMIFARVSVP